jgi:hypothetical protein
MKFVKFFVLFVVLALSHATHATAKLQQPNVLVGLHINDLRSMSFKNDSFVVDATLWFRWKDKSLNPHKSFKLLDAKIDAKKITTDIYLEDKEVRYAVVELVATVSKKWEISNFPFEKQVLQLSIEEEELEFDKILYGEDQENVHPNTKLEIHGWNVTGYKTYISENTYSTNFGDPRMPVDDVYYASEFNQDITIARASMVTGIKLLIAPLVAMFLMSAILRLPPTEAARMTVTTAALFALVSANYLVANMLPDSEGFSYAEKLITLGLVECGLYFVETVSALKLMKSGKEDLAKASDRRLFWILTLINAVFFAYTVIFVF